jgi:REP element-mobilizing transposase RayT
MPRGPRIDFPGAVHHVYARGIEKRNIFLDDSDRIFFLEKVGANLPRWGIRCHAWALMPNHFHLLLQSTEGKLPSFMLCLLTVYSRYFNSKHNRVGHFFQNRYKSPIVGKTAYFREVVRYIHLNPFRSGIVPSVEELGDFLWTGHRRIVKGGYPDWQNTEMVREEFGGESAGSGWVRTYLDFLERPVALNPTDLELDQLGPDAGTEDFKLDPRGQSYGEFLNILHRNSMQRGVSVADVLGGVRRFEVVDVRRVVLKECSEKMNVTLSLLSRWLGMKENTAAYHLKSSSRPDGKPCKPRVSQI